MSQRLWTMLGVEANERRGLLLALAYFFCLLASYSILRPVRSEMAAQIGVDALPQMMLAVFVMSLAITPAFGWITSRYPRRRMLPIVYAFCLSHLLLFAFAFATGLNAYWLSRGFYVWLTVYNMFIVSVFWSFMADLFAASQGKRLFPVIGAGGSAGAVTGTLLTQALVKTLGLGGILLLSAVFLSVCIVFIVSLSEWAQEGPASEVEESLRSGLLDGARLAFGSRYLLGICAFILIYTWTGIVLELDVTRIVRATMADSLERTQFFARLDAVVNVGTLLCQLFVAHRLLAWLGLTAGLVALPLLNVVGFLALGFTQSLAATAAFLAAQRIVEFALAKPAREVLFTVLEREEKYKAKNFIDTAIMRGGDAFSGWTVNGMRALGVLPVQLALAAATLAVAWAWLGRSLARELGVRQAGRR